MTLWHGDSITPPNKQSTVYHTPVFQHSESHDTALIVHHLHSRMNVPTMGQDLLQLQVDVTGRGHLVGH